LVGGGAERVACDLANHWSGQGREISVVTIDRGDRVRYPLADDIRRIGLDLRSDSRSLWQALRMNLRRVGRLRSVLRDVAPDTVISFTDVTNVTSLLACRGGPRTIVCERTDPRHHRIGTIWNWLRRWTYGRAAAIVVQNDSVRAWAVAQGWSCPIVVIPNPAPQWDSTDPATQPPDHAPTILALGRLSEEKGFHLLIEAFAGIAARFPGWQLRICGEGVERQRLEALIERLQLADRVFLPGWTEDAKSALRSADLFVLPSRYEGFPNALLEAMAMGLPCVSFDCDSGPREIIRQRLDGLLVSAGDVAGLAAAIAELMGDELLRRRLGQEAGRVVTRFCRTDILQRWDAVLEGNAWEE
jgi:glycosyltransferase involved in cell wall biosynthesis